MRRNRISELLAREQAGGEVLVQGWVKTRRSSKSVSFVQVNDGSTIKDIQVVADSSLPEFALVDSLTTGCSVSVVGTLIESPGKGQKYEIQAGSIELVGPSDPKPTRCKRNGTLLSISGRSLIFVPAPTPSAPWPASETPWPSPSTVSSKSVVSAISRLQSSLQATPKAPAPCLEPLPWTWRTCLEMREW